MRVRISALLPVARGVVALDLRSADGRELPAWTPGAHVDVHLAAGLTRQYSLCGDPGDRSVWRIAVRRQDTGRGGSRHVHERLSVQDVIEVGEPRNHFPLQPAARYVFLAGGIGITPILPMLAAAAAPWELHYAGRDAASMPFLDRLAGDGRVTLYPEDERGRIDLDPLLGRQPPGTLVYCCGPEGMLRAAEESCARRPDVSLRVERFTPAPAAGPVPRDDFEVELAATGRTLAVPAGRSILEVVEDAGVSVLSSCREGTCGTCETTVLAGAVDHRDSLLTPAERAAGDTILLCVSRAAGPRLVLDL
ncbi:ferredoxin [Actinoplanes philippinensis]|uniref:Ferredoxin-NADP reductase n=1 Tax=Actinoplanes philippinensis TaxID=35752 RepID=A0A1I2LBX9_9ACTN|nr:PDR/VanB family oxidoreductase [Actinoplanes philippinensis]GIE82433.1 ferredoxin [Actinoplanes philippinensis]SFF74586.1 Ferredoxin-NADP reductase [Actinoplanes philippinensis]